MDDIPRTSENILSQRGNTGIRSQTKSYTKHRRNTRCNSSTEKSRERSSGPSPGSRGCSVKKRDERTVNRPVNALSYIVSQEDCPKTLKIAQFNAQGLCTKYNDFIDFICSNDIDVCAITETWLCSEDSDSEFLPNGYQIFRKDRDITFYPTGCFTVYNRGGVAIVVKSELKPKLCVENNPRAELIWCDIEPLPGKVTTIGCCYRAEKGKDHSMSIICDSIDKVTNPNCILLGDFNFPNVNWSNEQSSDILSRKFIDTLQRNFWTQMNYSPTRKTNILDLVITNNTDCIYKIEVAGPIGNSDHDTVITEDRVPVIPRNRTKRKISLYSKETTRS